MDNDILNKKHKFASLISNNDSMKKILLLLFLLPTLLWAQDDAKYLAGAVPVEDGYVTFRQTFNAPSLSQKDLYQALLLWATQKFQPSKDFAQNRLITEDEATGELGAIGEEYIVFSSSLLSLDRTRIYYQFRAKCEQGSCTVEIDHIRYWYDEARDGGVRYRAEEIITDEHGLNKKKTKLARVIGKFREKTIDFKDQLFKEIEATLGKNAVQATPATTIPAQQPATATTVTTNDKVVTIGAAATTATTTAATAVVNTAAATASTVTTPQPVQATPAPAAKGMEGFKKIEPTQIPGNVIKMWNDYFIITAGNDELFNPMAGGWGGLGNLFNRPVAYCFIDPSRYTYGIMQKNNTYTLTFYTPAYQDAIQYVGTHSGRDGDKVAGSKLTPITTPSGSKAFAEAWLVIECKKIATQLLTPSSITDPAVKAKYPNKQTELFVGEIIGAWMK